MSTGTRIILSALRKIQVNTLNSPASPEDIDEAVPVLNSMLALWLSKEIDLGVVPLESAGNELGEPQDSTNAIISNLALYLADNYEDGQAIVTQVMRNNASRDLRDLEGVGYRKIVVPDKVPSALLLTGQGNNRFWSQRENFFGANSVIKDEAENA